MELIIEEVSRGHKLLGRHKFSQDEISLGRGYHNDLILSDPHICPAHLHIQHRDGQWFIRDLNTLNGSYLNHQDLLTEEHAIQSGDVISIGKSQFRFILADHPVAASIKISPFEELIKLCRDPLAIAANILVFAALSALMFYFNKAQEFTFSQIFVPAIGLTLLFSAWPLLCALISHLAKHEARVATQLGISFIIFNLFWFSDFLELLLSFNLSSNWSVGYVSILFSAALLFSLLWLNLYVAFNQNSRKRTLQAGSITLLLIGGAYLVDLSQQPEFSIHPDYNNVLMSPNFAIAPPSSVDDFLAQSDSLFEKNNKAVAESKKEQ
jgi:hypothetical protein